MGRRFPRAVAVALAILCAACSGSDPGPRQSPGPVAGEKVSTDNSLPAEYPKDDLPPPSPSTVIYSAVGQFGISVFFTSSLPDEEVKRRFLDTLRSKRWTLHTCQGAGDTTLMVASRPGYVVSIAIGFNPANAERIGGKRYSFFLSIATKGDRPKPTATPC